MFTLILHASFRYAPSLPSMNKKKEKYIILSHEKKRFLH